MNVTDNWPYLTLPYLTLPSGWAGCYTCQRWGRISLAQYTTPM